MCIILWIDLRLSMFAGQSCTGGATISSTASVCPPPSDYNQYTTFTPTPVVTSPATTQPPPTTPPPPPPITVIPGLSWHIFTGSLHGWSAQLRGCRASVYPWILGNVRCRVLACFFSVAILSIVWPSLHLALVYMYCVTIHSWTDFFRTISCNVLFFPK